MTTGVTCDGADAVRQVCYLDYSSRRLREIPERNSKQTQQRGLRLVSLRAASAQDAAPCRTTRHLSGTVWTTFKLVVKKIRSQF